MVKIINILGLALVGTAAANEPLARKDVKQLFKSADSNADRQLDLAELDAYFSTLSEEEVGQILAIGDNNGDGELNFNEFFKVIDDDDNRFWWWSWLEICGLLWRGVSAGKLRVFGPKARKLRGFEANFKIERKYHLKSTQFSSKIMIMFKQKLRAQN